MDPQLQYRRVGCNQESLWWYLYDAGGFPKAQWEIIGGDWYYFDESGWMQTGWKFIGDAWYYLNESGAMLSNGLAIWIAITAIIWMNPEK